MGFYKDTNNALHSLSDTDIANGGEDLLPAGSVPISDEEADAIRSYRTPQQLQAEIVAEVQKHLDETAASLGYDDMKTAVGYADEPAVPKFQADGQALRAWRSLVWDKCYTELARVQAGQRSIPTPAEAIAELPAFVPPEV